MFERRAALELDLFADVSVAYPWRGLWENFAPPVSPFAACLFWRHLHLSSSSSSSSSSPLALSQYFEFSRCTGIYRLCHHTRKLCPGLFIDFTKLLRYPPFERAHMAGRLFWQSLRRITRFPRNGRRGGYWKMAINLIGTIERDNGVFFFSENGLRDCFGEKPEYIIYV